ncbi:hypothetical protein PA598K_07107 [Paenibacillus sp. 598K]|nr:hypothetical protein PA598K_07107 [Paenibacillus sp. 598K]
MAVGIGEPVLILAVIRCAAPARRSLALAGRLTANRLAMLLAPLAAGAAIQLAGAGPGLLLLGLLLALIATGAARLFWKYGSL